jgi:hypothetical protein
MVVAPEFFAQRTEKNENGYFDNLHQNYYCPKWSKFWKKKSRKCPLLHQKWIFLSSLKTKTEVQLSLSTNWFQSIFEFGIQKFCSSNRKTFFEKNKKQKIQNFEIPCRTKKKTISEKSSSTTFFYPLGELMFEKSSKSEMVTGCLVL